MGVSSVASSHKPREHRPKAKASKDKASKVKLTGRVSGALRRFVGQLVSTNLDLSPLPL